MKLTNLKQQKNKYAFTSEDWFLKDQSHISSQNAN